MRFKKGLAIVTAFALTLSALTGCSRAKVDKKEFSSTVAATFGDENIYLDEMLFYTRLEQSSLDYYYSLYTAFGMFQGTLEEFYKQKGMFEDDMTNWEAVKQGVLHIVYQTHVLNDYANEHGITLTDTDKENIANEVKEFTEGEHAYIVEGTEISAEAIERFITQNALANRAHIQLCEGYDPEVDREAFLVARVYYLQIAKDKDDQTDEAARIDAVYNAFRDAYDKAEKDITKVDLDKIVADFTDAEDAEHRIKVVCDKDTTMSVGGVDTTHAKAVAALSEGEFAKTEDENYYYAVYLSAKDDAESTQSRIDQEIETRKEAKFNENYKTLLETAKELKLKGSVFDANIKVSAINYPTQAPVESTSEEVTEAGTAEATTAEVTTAEVTTAEATTAEAPTEEATTEEASVEDATTGEEATEEGPTEEVTEEATVEATEEPTVEATEEVAPTDAE